MKLGRFFRDDKNRFSLCVHPLFEWEEDYIICPSCGSLIDRNLPPKEDTSDDARLYHYYSLAKQSIWPKIEKVIFIFIIPITVALLGDLISRVILRSGNYGFYNFATSSRKGSAEAVENAPAITSLIFAVFLAWREKYRRTFLIMSKLERFYDIYYHWGIQLLLFGLLTALVSSFFPQLSQFYASGKMDAIAEKHHLTPEQIIAGKELHLRITRFIAVLTAIEIIVYNLVATASSKYLRRLNEEYLYDQ